MLTNDAHDILVLVLPTNEPATFYEYFLESLPNMKAVAPITTVAINFQAPWTRDLIDDAVETIAKLGFKCEWCYSQYCIEGKGKVPFNRIRDDAAKLVPNGLIYALTDDDFKYQGPSATIPKTAGEQYIDAVHYLLTHEKCGLISMVGTMYKKTPRNHIGPCQLWNTYITSKGFLLKSLNKVGGEGLTLPTACLDLVGSDEERVSTGARMALGYYPAKLPFSRTAHYEHHGKGVLSGSDTYQWNTEDILDSNNSKFIKDNYNPKYRKRQYGGDQPCSTENYLNAGGIDMDSEVNRVKYTVNYEDSDSESLLEEIIRMAVL